VGWAAEAHEYGVPLLKIQGIGGKAAETVLGTIVVIVAFGAVRAPVIDHLCRALKDAFACECRLGGGLPVPAGALDMTRNQHSAEAILQRLKPGAGELLLGVVDLDLYVPDLNFVFGLADRPGRRALIALPRLRQRFYGLPDDEELFLARTAKEAVHELGHVLGVGHCNDRRCVMAFSNSLADTDYKGRSFCPKCLKSLGSND